MTTPPDDHTLNACLARRIGRKVSEVKIGTYPNHVYTWMVFEANQWVKWNPLHDANQMEEVEAELEKTCNFEYVKYVENKIWACHLWTNAMREAVVGSDPDKKRAFALAVWEMEQAQQP